MATADKYKIINIRRYIGNDNEKKAILYCHREPYNP